MDALERLGDHRADAEQQRALGRPVARGARAVLLAREHDERRPGRLVPLGRVEDRDPLARRQVLRHAALGAGHEEVAEPDVRERPARHDAVVAAPRAERVEVGLRDALRASATPPAGPSAGMSPAGLMWSVVTRVAERREAARARGSGRSGLRLLRRCRRRRAGPGCRCSRPPRGRSRPSGSRARSSARCRRRRSRSARRRSSTRGRRRRPARSPRSSARRPSGRRACRHCPMPSGSVVRSRSTVPAIAYATTSGGLAR